MEGLGIVGSGEDTKVLNIIIINLSIGIPQWQEQNV